MMAEPAGEGLETAGGVILPATRRLRWWTVAWTLVLCAGCLAVPVHTYRRNVNGLATPETAMYGPAILDAGLACSWAFFAAMAVLGAATARHAFSKSTRVLTVLPVLTMLPACHLYRHASDDVEAAPAFHRNFAASETELDALADRVDAGESIVLPVRAGAFTVARGEKLDSGAVVLYTKENPVTWDEARWGFIRDVSQAALEGPASITGMRGELGEQHSVRRLGPGWYVLYHQYWFIKRGWS